MARPDEATRLKPAASAQVTAGQGRRIFLVRLTAAVLAVSGLASLLPQHEVNTWSLALCLAPDCRSSASHATYACGGFANPTTTIVLVLIGLSLAAHLVTLRLGRGRVAASISALVCAPVAAAALLAHGVIGHLLDTVRTLPAGLGVFIGLGLVAVLGVLQLLTSRAHAG